MKIAEITEEHILFDNGNEITCDHYRSWCEHNWADFDQIDDLARSHNYDENLKFESVENSGFRFGDSNFMAFVPCYSAQNGYYSSDVDIYYNGNNVLNCFCELI